MSEQAPPGSSGPATVENTHENGETHRGSFGQTLREAILEGNSVTVTFLAIFTAMVIGGLLNAFTNTKVLHAWVNFFSAPGAAITQAWDVAIGAYVALFEGSIFNPHTVAALFQQASFATAVQDGYLSAVFNPLSETCVQATPLLLAGLAVALPYQAGMFNIGAQGQFIGGAILATYLGYGVSLPFGVHVIVCVIGGFVGGAIIGWVVGELKARTGAHEVIVTIMLNYIMAYLLAFLLGNVMQRPGRTDLISPFIAGNAHLPLLFGSHLRINAGIPGRAGVRVRRVVAALPDHDRLRVPEHRQEPERVPGGRHERGALLGPGDADRRRARRAGRLDGHPGHRLQPQLPELRDIRH